MKKWSPFFCFGIRSAIFWHLKTGTFAKQHCSPPSLLDCNLMLTRSQLKPAKRLVPNNNQSIKKIKAQQLPDSSPYMFPSISCYDNKVPNNVLTVITIRYTLKPKMDCTFALYRILKLKPHALHSI